MGNNVSENQVKVLDELNTLVNENDLNKRGAEFTVLLTSLALSVVSMRDAEDRENAKSTLVQVIAKMKNGVEIAEKLHEFMRE